MAKKKVTNTTSRLNMSESDFNAYVDELYDHGMDAHEVDEHLRYMALQRRTSPKGRDYDNEYVWNTTDRLDRALTLANRRLGLIREYEDRAKQTKQLMDLIRLQIGMFGNQESAKVMILAAKAFLETPVSQLRQDPSVTTDRLICAICDCKPCAERINGESTTCCGHKDDLGSWGLPF